MKKLIEKAKELRFGNVLSALLMVLAVSGANSACAFWIYQEEECDEIKALRKF